MLDCAMLDCAVWDSGVTDTIALSWSMESPLLERFLQHDWLPTTTHSIIEINTSMTINIMFGVLSLFLLLLLLLSFHSSSEYIG